MINIDETLENARSNASTWDSMTALRLASEIGSSPGWVADWDPGAGESWIRVIAVDRVVALVSVSLPVAILDESVSAANAQWGTVGLIVVSDLDAPVLSASQPVLSHTFGESDRLGMIDVLRFSANDLWYATV